MWNTGENKIEVELIFIRHGKTKGNLEGRYIGRLDESLCEEGIEAIKNKEYPDVDFAFVSPMKRCQETLNLIYPNVTRYVIDEFKEIYFGDYEGMNYAQLNGKEEYQRFIDSGGRTSFPNAEKQEEFVERVMRGFEQAVEIIKKENLSKVAFVVHGGTIMAILSNLLGGEYFDYQIKNGETYTCSITL